MKLILIYVLAGLASANTSQPSVPGYVVHQSISLSPPESPRLEVLRDDRLTEADIAQIAEHDPDDRIEDSPKFKKTAPHPAALTLKSNRNEILQTLLLEKPNAVIEPFQTQAKTQDFFVTQDFGIGFGSYNGPITRILETESQTMRWATTTGEDGEPEPISLMRSLKSDWRMVRNREGGQDILAVNCYPNLESPGNFTTTYSRYQKTAQGWTVVRRKKQALWESGPFPKTDLFPLE